MLYRIGRWVLFPFMRVLFRFRVIGRENLPIEKGFLLCSNHLSVCDPCFLAAACWPLFSKKRSCRRPIRYMAKSELFTEHGKIATWLLKSLGGFPVERDSADRNSLRKACEILKQGEILGIFPQGRCVKDSAPFRPKSGAALIACKTEMPIVPACIQANRRLRLFSRITVRIGESFFLKPNEMSLPEKEQMRCLSRRMAEKINLLLEENL